MTAAPGVPPKVPRGSYRPDIDGLRAFAVLPVILFHAHFFCPGGFVGVDVFFVISGYLITKIIERDLAEGTFSVIVFYQRRIRRIFPALFTMFAVSTFIAFVGLPAAELKDFGKSLLASSAFSSNILFFRQAGYFATGARFQPLLHTWTLSVEEQFYLFWPLLLWGLSSRAVSKWKITVVISLLVGTLMLSAHWVSHFPNAAFFLLPSRTWELALGAVLTLQPVSKALTNLPRRLASAASLCGLCMLAAALVLYDEVTPFPGVAALLPCMGAVLIIASGEGGPSLGGKILALRPVVWVGLISYSLYLWHWPILVFGRLILNHESGLVQRGILVLLTFVVAWLSWKFVESPIRHVQVARAKSRNWVIGGVGTTIFFVALGATLFLSKGSPARQPNVTSLETEVQLERDALQGSPCLARQASVPDAGRCLVGASSPNLRYDAVLWGDSHAAALAPGINEIGSHLGVTVREMTKAGCPPVPGVKFYPVAEMRVDCPAFNDAALKAVLADKEVRVVILAARWDAIVEGPVRAYSGNESLLTLDGTRPTINDSQQLFVVSLRRLLTILVDSGHSVILVGEVPLPPEDIIECVARARFHSQNESVCKNSHPQELAKTDRLVNQSLLQAAASLKPIVQIAEPYESLCGGREGCRFSSDGRLLYIDDSHLSKDGAHLVGIGIEKSLVSALAATKN